VKMVLYLVLGFCFLLVMYLSFGGGFVLAVFLFLKGKPINDDPGLLVYLKMLVAWPRYVYYYVSMYKEQKDKWESLTI